jgi:hypothetical protein
MPEPTRYLTVPEAMLMRWWNTKHYWADVYAAPGAPGGSIVPTSDKKIVISFLGLHTDVLSPALTISCTGVDTVYWIYIQQAPWRAGEALFIGATNEPVNFEKDGSSGTYFHVWASYYEL